MEKNTINLGGYYRKKLTILYDYLVPKTSKRIRLKSSIDQVSKNADYVIIDNLVGDIDNVQDYLLEIFKKCRIDTKLIITYYNHLWEPILKLATILGLRNKVGEQNWLDNKDIANLLSLSGFDVITMQRRLLMPLDIPFISYILNNWLAHLPLINSLCLTTFVVARPKPSGKREYSVSIVVPARNEAGNIPKIIQNIPKFGKWQEIIFVEGHSQDNTWTEILKQVQKSNPKDIKVKALRQKGIGKADAVRLGLSKSSAEMLMILDADLTVNPKELKKFYDSLAERLGDFANGNRLVYPMEKQAMRTLNKLGNKIFSMLFTWILGQRFKDTLCGTKALFAKDYKWIAKNRKYFGKIDPFGDFDLIFGAVKKNLKVVEIPVRYRERTYGSTNITRFKHGLQLLFMTWVAFRKFKAW